MREKLRKFLQDNPQIRRLLTALLFAMIVNLVVIGTIVVWKKATTVDPIRVPFNAFEYMERNGEVSEVVINSNSPEFTFYDADGREYVTDNPKSTDFKREMLQYGVKVTELQSSILLSVIITIVEYAILVLAMTMIMKSVMPGSKSLTYTKTVPSVTFADVAGEEELKQDLQFVIDYLKDPNPYKKVGAKMPKGIILYGPPGTGKTLTAKALAGTAGVPFFSATGSDFVEMYVGLGAKRVRDLFRIARQNAPCIIFIDEIDAVGFKRDASGSNSETNQTINALLNEMDGFDESSGIFIIAATNRLQDLDPALIRTGRFDKQLAVPLPEKEDRKAVIDIHRKNKQFDDAIDWNQLAAETVGFSGSDIASLLNEAAFIAAGNKHDKISADDIDRAMFKLIMKGDRRTRTNVNEDRNLHICAIHEAGHAIAALHFTTEEVNKITIVASTSGAGGVTFVTPTTGGLISKRELEGKIRMLYAGRAAEEILFTADGVTTGASNDLQRASELIKEYIGSYGMGSSLMCVAPSNDSAEFRQQCDAVARCAYNDVKSYLSSHVESLTALGNALLEKETLSHDEIISVLTAAEKEQS